MFFLALLYRARIIRENVKISRKKKQKMRYYFITIPKGDTMTFFHEIKGKLEV